MGGGGGDTSAMPRRNWYDRNLISPVIKINKITAVAHKQATQSSGPAVPISRVRDMALPKSHLFWNQTVESPFAWDTAHA